ncbi:MAG: hypothetical protein IPG34_10215 [Rhodocyclaceae bacterium]|nr:hypothetical protein [Rhodocyclaceae bacterium]
MTLNLRLVYYAIGLLAILFASAARSNDLLDAAQPWDGPVPLARYFDVLEDPQGTLTLADVRKADIAARFKPSSTTKDALNYGITPSTYWLRLSLKNGGDQPIERFLEIAYARLLTVDFYKIAPGQTDQVIESGYGKPFDSRVYKHRFFVFPVTLAPQTEHVIYLRVQSRTSLEIPAKLWKPREFHVSERLDYMAQAAYFGMAGAMILFNFLLLMSLRDRGYLLYILFVVANASGIAASTGIGIEYFWGDFPDWTTLSFAASAHATGVFLAAFMRHMVGTATLLPKWDKLIIALIAINAGGFVLQFFTYQVKFVLAMMIISALLIIAVAIYLSLKRNRAAYLFLAAFTVLLASVVILSLRISGLLPSNFFTINGVQIGSALEMIVLAFALADRFHVLRAEKERAQQEALSAERRVVETLKASERILETRVEERTAELSATVDRLKQTQSDLVEAEKLASLGSLVAGVAHELNTPIGNALTTATALEGSTRSFQELAATQSLKRSSLDGFLNTTLEMGQLVVRSLFRAAQLISSFKQVAVDQTSERKRCFDLRELVENNIATLRPSFKNASWSLHVDPIPQILCDSYPGPLGQIVVNIVQNAHIHAFEGRASGQLRITARTIDDQVELKFIDDGIGMSKESVAHVFDPFYTTKLGKGGSGLGMAISRNMAMHLGGSLSVKSIEGQGTTFTLRIPLIVPDSADSPNEAEPVVRAIQGNSNE